VNDVRFFSPKQKATLEQRMRAAELDVSRANSIALMGRGSSLLAVMDPSSLRLLAIIDPS
jgi:hypothetical protein